MKVTLQKDVLTPHNGVGRVGQTVEMNSTQAHEYIKAGLATGAAEGAAALPVDPPTPAKTLTNGNLKEDKGPKARETKEDKANSETK